MTIQRSQLIPYRNIDAQRNKEPDWLKGKPCHT